MATESFIPKKFADKLLHRFRSDKAIKYIEHGSTVCDLGCGWEGSFLKRIEKIIGKGLGFDFSVNERFNSGIITLQALDLNTAIPLPDSSIDTVTSMAVLEHLNNYEMFVGEIHRILKGGGVAILSTPARSADPVIKTLGFLGLIDRKQACDHKNYFNTKQLTKLFKDSGFADVKIKKFQFGLNRLVVGRK